MEMVVCNYRLVKHSYCNTLINMLYDPYAFHTVLRYVGPITVLWRQEAPPTTSLVPALVKDVYTAVPDVRLL